MGEETDVRIIPFRGEYYKLAASSSHRLGEGADLSGARSQRFPFLGVHYTRNIHGYVEAGPNAVLAWAREGYRKRQRQPGRNSGRADVPRFLEDDRPKHWRTGMQGDAPFLQQVSVRGRPTEADTRNTVLATWNPAVAEYEPRPCRHRAPSWTIFTSCAGRRRCTCLTLLRRAPRLRW